MVRISFTSLILKTSKMLRLDEAAPVWDSRSKAFQPFELEQWQSELEQTVEINLADSSVRAVTVRELFGDDPEHLERLLSLPVHYPEVNGTALLRERIAALYENTSPDHVLVTVGAAEANQIICQTLLGAGDEVIVMEPGYRQVWGLAQNL